MASYSRIVLDKDENFEKWFEVEDTVKWILSNEYKRVALQLPDSLLNHAFRLTKSLKAHLAKEDNNSIDLFVLADTSYGECCVDQASASHNAADSVVHYGRSCLSRPTYLPTFLVFCDLGTRLDLTNASKFAEDHAGKRVYIEIDVVFEGCRAALERTFQERQVQTQFSIPPPRELIPLTKDPSMARLSSDGDFSSFDAVLFVGPARSPQLDRLSFACATSTSSCPVYSLNPDTLEIGTSQSSRALARRFVMVEKCKDASIIGILIGTMSVALFGDVIARVKKAIELSGKKSYSFVFGKLSPSKLANFPDVDAFVLVACSFNTLIDSKEFNKPIVTPYELEVALNIRDWGSYIWNFSQLLEVPLDQEQTDKKASEDDAEDVRFSLASGKLMSVPKKKPAVQTLTLRYESPAAESLASRTFKGLDPSTSHLAPAKATAGQIGVASRLYQLDGSQAEQPR